MYRQRLVVQLLHGSDWPLRLLQPHLPVPARVPALPLRARLRQLVHLPAHPVQRLQARVQVQQLRHNANTIRQHKCDWG